MSLQKFTNLLRESFFKTCGWPDETSKIRRARGSASKRFPRRTATREEILMFLEGKIAKWWMPDDVVFVEELPHSATGKSGKLHCGSNSRLTDHQTESVADAQSATRSRRSASLMMSGKVRASGLSCGEISLLGRSIIASAAQSRARGAQRDGYRSA